MSRKIVTLLVGVLVAVGGLANAGLAQSAVSVQGTVQSVDCQRQTLVLRNANGSNTVAATGSTAVNINSTAAPFCTLQQYVGDSATAWLVPSGSQFQVTRIDVVGPASSASAPAPTVHSPSALTLALGALAVGALGYVIGHSSANRPVYPQGSYYGPGGYYPPGYQGTGYNYPQGYSGPGYYPGSGYYPGPGYYYPPGYQGTGYNYLPPYGSADPSGGYVDPWVRFARYCETHQNSQGEAAGCLPSREKEH